MKQHILATLACICSAVVIISAVPLPVSNQELDVLQIPLSNGKELDVLTLGAKDQEQLIAERNKRTIGLLRELFPDITKQIDEQIDRVVNSILRQFGPGILGTALNPLLNRGANPTGTIDKDDDDGNFGDIPTNLTINQTTFHPDEEFNNGATDTQIDLSAINKQLEETIRVARQVKEAEAAAASALQQQYPIPKPDEPIQLSFNNEVSPLTINDNSDKTVNNDLQLSESKSPAIDELSLDSNEDTADLDDRNKRFLSFGGAGLAGSSSGGSGGAGGSGNFLFDIVRLFSGSVQTQNGDEAANSVNSVSGSSDSGSDTDANRAADGYSEGIPGPVTRLVVLANRGLANLVQDLILRVAATSEKFVNFKAKLITALI